MSQAESRINELHCRQEDEKAALELTGVPGVGSVVSLLFSSGLNAEVVALGELGPASLLAFHRRLAPHPSLALLSSPQVTAWLPAKSPLFQLALRPV